MHHGLRCIHGRFCRINMLIETVIFVFDEHLDVLHSSRVNRANHPVRQCIIHSPSATQTLSLESWMED